MFRPGDQSDAKSPLFSSQASLGERCLKVIAEYTIGPCECVPGCPTRGPWAACGPPIRRRFDGIAAGRQGSNLDKGVPKDFLSRWVHTNSHNKHAESSSSDASEKDGDEKREKDGDREREDGIHPPESRRHLHKRQTSTPRRHGTRRSFERVNGKPKRKREREKRKSSEPRGEERGSL
ncbi:hypothetical protein TNCV_2078971 [Trichonephila clavipes]|nr:hypothetical protein TNCV_2078971 [Trichonephila clavipes]